MKKKTLVLLLAAALLVQTLAGCSDGGVHTDTPEDTAAAAETETAASTETEAEEDGYEQKFTEAKKLYEDRDYEGYAFRIADRAGKNSHHDWKTFDVYAEGLNGEVINDAVYTRNTALEEAMNIKIVECPFGMDEVSSNVRNSILANLDEYDIMTDGLSHMSALVTDKYVRDFREIGTIHPENPWWDAQIYEDLSLLGKSFFMTGDISVMDNQGTWGMVFNKSMVRDLGLDNPYELVDSGKWTFDAFRNMIEQATRDVDGDGKWTKADDYGFLTEDYNTIALWNCFGHRIVGRDADMMPIYTYEGEDSITALMEVVEVQRGPFSNMGLFSEVGTRDDATREMQFAAGKALFHYAGLVVVTLLRDSDTDFGIIPAPKYDEAQEEYHSSYSFCNFTAYAMPITVTDPDKSGDITEAMAHLSKYTLTPAYYDKTLIGKATRDEESEPMIELILSTRYYDLGSIYDWGGVFSTIHGMRETDTVASTLKRTGKVAKRHLERFIKQMTEE